MSKDDNVMKLINNKLLGKNRFNSNFYFPTAESVEEYKRTWKKPNPALPSPLHDLS